MREQHKTTVLMAALLIAAALLSAQDQQPRRPSGFTPYRHRYSIEDLQRRFSGPMMAEAAREVGLLDEVNRRGPYAPTLESLATHPVPEWYWDAKLGVFLDWGLYSVAGYGEKRFARARYPDWYLDHMYNVLAPYHAATWGADFERDDFIPLFTASRFDARELVALVKASGARYLVPFSKHHDGFCLWASRFTERDVADTSPGLDVTARLAAECRRQGLRHGFYFSVEEWEYPLLLDGDRLGLRLWSTEVPAGATVESRGDPLALAFDSARHNRTVSGKVPVRDFVSQYLLPQAKEFIDVYDPDILWFDGDWTRPASYYRTPDLVAYFYNRARGRKEVAANDRLGKGTRGHSGDFYTSETDEIVSPLDHPWEENRSMGESYGYYWKDEDSTLLTTDELVQMLVRVVAKGGNLMLLVSPDGTGRIPENQASRLRDIGAWLRVNGEAIFDTRPHSVVCDSSQLGQNVWYTRSKDGRYAYAIVFSPPTGESVILKSAKPVWEKNVTILGYPHPLAPNESWVDTGSAYGMVVRIPEELRRAGNRPPAWVIRYETR
jgi:alpha-L-fucosidase